MRDTMIKALLLIVLVSTVGCAAYLYSATTNVTAPTKAEGCYFDVLTIRPHRAYDELGVLDRQLAASDAGAFREAVADDVCRVGGDAVLAEVNGLGQYIRGIVIRYRP